MMANTAIRLAGRLRHWAIDIFENGPSSFREKASIIISYCDEFVKEYDRDLEYILSGGADKDVNEREAHKIMLQSLFFLHGQIGKNLLPKVLKLCLEANIKAPEGWHGRLVIPSGFKNKDDILRATTYRKRFIFDPLGFKGKSGCTK